MCVTMCVAIMNSVVNIHLVESQSMVECGNLTLKALWNESTSASKELGDKVSKWCVHVHIHGNNWSNECARACMGGRGEVVMVEVMVWWK